MDAGARYQQVTTCAHDWDVHVGCVVTSLFPRAGWSVLISRTRGTSSCSDIIQGVNPSKEKCSDTFVAFLVFKSFIFSDIHTFFSFFYLLIRLITTRKMPSVKTTFLITTWLLMTSSWLQMLNDAFDEQCIDESRSNDWRTIPLGGNDNMGEVSYWWTPELSECFSTSHYYSKNKEWRRKTCSSLNTQEFIQIIQWQQTSWFTWK